MPHVLLAGAGFSRNWGGWLANEAFEYLTGSPEIDDHIRHLLWTHKGSGGGFEEALAELQRAYTHSKTDRTRKPLADLQAAIVGMFNYMNLAFEGIQFEPENNMKYLIKAFMDRFDAIFTLNHMWTVPACEGVEVGLGEMVGCSHMSGPLVRCR